MYNILICDDQPDIVNALKIYLTPEGYHLYEAFTGKEALAVSAVNKDPEQAYTITLPAAKARQLLLNGPSKDSYNDVDRKECVITAQELNVVEGTVTVTLPPHSVSVIEIE